MTQFGTLCSSVALCSQIRILLPILFSLVLFQALASLVLSHPRFLHTSSSVYAYIAYIKFRDSSSVASTESIISRKYPLNITLFVLIFRMSV